jgi:hypothetical protein
MPYELKEIKDATGYKKWKVCKQDDMDKCFSKQPLTKTRAKAQMRALYASENNKNKNRSPKRTSKGKLIIILIKKHNLDEEEVKREVEKLDEEEAQLVINKINY